MPDICKLVISVWVFTHSIWLKVRECLNVHHLCVILAVRFSVMKCPLSAVQVKRKTLSYTLYSLCLGCVERQFYCCCDQLKMRRKEPVRCVVGHFSLLLTHFVFCSKEKTAFLLQKSSQKTKYSLLAALECFYVYFFRNQPAPLTALSMSITCTVPMLLYHIVFYL